MLTADRVKARAREIGFDLCGIAPAEALPRLTFLAEWLGRGYAGEMAYLNRTAERRADVRAVLPAARAVVVLGTLYNTAPPYSTEVSDAGAAVISRYAWGDDYHDVVGARTGTLQTWMTQAEPGIETRAYVDTGPVQEKVYAERAGLGWIGKNTCLINPDLGSWLFLSEILCSAPLAADAPGFDQCGTCTLCLDACPTGAFPEPGVLDATRCVSYLTIETKGVLPVADRPGLEGRVYGCDVCQEVCPFNGAAPISDDPAWQPRALFDQPKLAELWRRSDAELRAAIRRGAMTRVRVKRLRRNVAVAMGNSGGPESAAALDQDAVDRRPEAESVRDPLVAEHVAWARARLESRGDDEPPNLLESTEGR